jgi:hypothetical protein
MKWFHQTAQISCQRGLRKFRAEELCAKHVPFIVVLQEIIKVSAIGPWPVVHSARRGQFWQSLFFA